MLCLAGSRDSSASDEAGDSLVVSLVEEKNPRCCPTGLIRSEWRYAFPRHCRFREVQRGPALTIRRCHLGTERLVLRLASLMGALFNAFTSTPVSIGGHWTCATIHELSLGISLFLSKKLWALRVKHPGFGGSSGFYASPYKPRFINGGANEFMTGTEPKTRHAPQ